MMTGPFITASVEVSVTVSSSAQSPVWRAIARGTFVDSDSFTPLERELAVGGTRYRGNKVMRFFGGCRGAGDSGERRCGSGDTHDG